MKSRNILLVTPYFPPQTGGAATYFYYLHNSLIKSREVNSYVLTTRNQARSGRQKENNIIRRIPNVIISNVIVRTTVLPLYSFIYIARLVKKYHITVLHVHSSTAIVIGAVIYALLFKVKLILEVQDLMTPIWLLRWSGANHYIATGTAVARRISMAGIEKQKITTINSVLPIQVDTATSRNNEDSLQFIFVGELNVKNKKIDLLLQAFQDLLKKNVSAKLTLIGSGPDEAYCREYIQKHNLSNIVRLEHEMTHPQTLREIAKSDVLVIASLSEGVPRVIIEAFNFGKPVIATRVGGIPEVVYNDSNGILVEPNNKLQLSQAMYKIATDDNLRNTLAAGARKTTAKLAPWDDEIRKIIRIYQL